MNTLNDYCLLHIFKYFDIKDRLNASKVCERWNNLLKTQWKETKFMILNDTRIEKDYLCPKDIREIIRRCGPSLRDVSLIPLFEKDTMTFVQFDGFKYSITSSFTIMDVLEELTKVAFNISSLYICSCNNSLLLMKKLLSSNKKLNNLEIEGGFNFLGDSIYLEVLPESLEEVSFSFVCLEVYDFCMFLKRMSNLKKLKLIDNDLITDETLLSLSMYSTQLQTLHLEEDMEEQTTVTMAAIECISNLVNLKELSIKGFVTVMTDNVLIRITSKCTKITVLALSDCPRITDVAMKCALSNLPDLRVLELKNMSVSKLTNCRLLLKKLKVYRCHSLTSDALCQAIQMSPLTHLEIHTPRPVSETVMYTAITAAISRNQKFIITSDINAVEMLEVTVYKKNTKEKQVGQSIFYYYCESAVSDWLTKMKDHVSSTFPDCQIFQEIKQRVVPF